MATTITIDDDEIRGLEHTETEREAAETARRGNEDIVHRFFTLSRELLSIADIDGCLIRVNPAWEATLGWTPEELTGKPFVDFVHPDDRAGTLEAIEQLATGQGLVAFENRYRCRDGSFRWLQWSSVAAPEQGMVYAAARDITSGKEAEEENEGIVHRFFTLSRELLSIADIDGCLLRVNPAWEATLGWTPEELTGKPFVDFVHPDDREGTLDAIEQLATGQGLVAFENRYRCSDGSFRWLQWSSVAAPEQGLVYAAARDITDRKDAEEVSDEVSRRSTDDLEQRVAARTAELSAANQELEAFAYSVSHDLRAPLRGIDGFSQAVLEEYSDKLDDRGQDYLLRLRSASQRMGILIDDILNLSRISRVEPGHDPVDLSAIAMSAAAEMREREPDREVEFVIAAGLAGLGDSRFLSIVFENLFANAVKFTSTHPTARIEFGRERVDGKDAYFVRDDGVGFDMAYSDQLFVPFHRLHRQTDFPGTGIGLATVRRIVRRHGGRTWAHGEVGKGATVYFTLGEMDE